MEDKIDIHKMDKKYESALHWLEQDRDMNQRNKELIQKFIWDCKIGKTIKRGSKRKIGKMRLVKYIYTLKTLSGWLDKPFDEVSQKDMEKLVFGIEENEYKNQERNYSEETKIDFKRTLRKFYRWLDKVELLSFMDMSYRPKEAPAMTRDEVEELIKNTTGIKMKAILMVLFDGGARIGELLNLRLKDVEKRKYMNLADCHWINIRYSKTEPRTIPLPLSKKHLDRWLAEHPDKDNPEAQVFPFSYNGLRKRIITLGNKVLKKRINLHMFRHSSATYWGGKMNHIQFCVKYGWDFNSDMPKRYIKRKGIILDEIAQKGDTDQLSKLEMENRHLRRNMEDLEDEHRKFKMVLKSIMPLIAEKDPDFKERLFEVRKDQLMMDYREEKTF
jgi:integrase